VPGTVAPRSGAPGDGLRGLTRLIARIGAIRGLDELVRVAAAEAAAVLGAPAVSVSRWEPNTGRAQLLASHGEPGPRARRFPAGDRYTVGDVLIAPILLDGVPWGELVARRRPDQPSFEAADVDLATVVAAQVAAGVVQARRLERVERLAYRDPLTGLANRRSIDARLDRAIERHRRDGTVVSLLVCDVNGLKRLNDERGHDVGDRLLRDIAALLSRCGESLPGSLAARLGGDEFCLLAEGPSADEMVRVAEDVCRLALQLAHGEGVACGVASTGDPVGDVVSAERLFRLADAAQYGAKRGRAARPMVAGRGQIAPDLRIPLPRLDRRRFRGLVAEDPAQLLSAGLAGLDAAGPAPAVDRLEVVADTASRLVDAVGWWVSAADPGGRHLRTRRFSVYRMTGEPSPARHAHDAAGAEFDLSAYPLSAAAVDGGGFALEAGAPGNDPAEEFILLAGGYQAVLAAGSRHQGAGWLVEVFTDEISGPVRGLVQPLRALVAVALTGAV
jgi:diguanylate cyclase (GGDEF)-like protein